MSTRTLGIIGSGAVVEHFHLNALRSIDRTRWKLAFFDLDRERAAQVASHVGGEAHAWTGEPQVRLDAAIVATPPQTHHPIVRSLLLQGTHVLCEKPFVLDRKDGDELVDLARENDARLLVNQTRRFFPASGLARSLVKEGRIGSVRSVYVQEGGRFNWPTKSSFYFDEKLERNGVLYDRGSHIFDLIAWVTGADIRPAVVVVDGKRGPEATACVDFTADGLTGSCLMTWLADIPRTFRIEGDRGTITIDDNWNRLHLQVGDRGRWMWGGGRGANLADHAPKVLRDFLGACDGDASLVDAATVLPSISFLEDAYAIAERSWRPDVLEVAP